MNDYLWSEEKNQYLKSQRGVTFEDVVKSIKTSGLLNIEESPSRSNHPTQLCFIVKINNYIYAVPFVIQRDGSIFLKTLFPSRKLNKKYNN